MPPLYTLCYPRLSIEDRRFIDAFRREHDTSYCDVVAPHFTLAFAIDEVPEPVYREHVAAIARSQAALPFCCRYAMVGSDEAKRNFYVFLVPDEGYAAISRLHDRLYAGVLAPYLRLDIAYVPHIGIATGADALQIKSLCDELNANGVEIRGQIDTLSVCAYDGTKVTSLESFACGAPQP